MARKKTLPSRLMKAQQRFAQWRRTHTPGTRIPKPLWAHAVKLASTYGVSKTANTLKLNYQILKKRLEQASSSVQASPIPAFVELAPPTLAAPAECIVELEDAAGSKMRIHLKGGDTPDLVALGCSFWNVER